jgi:hypothetical protein
MSTYTTDHADSGEIPRPGEQRTRIHVRNQPGEYGVKRLIGESTTNLASQRLRAQGQVYSSARLSVADTMTIRTDLTADPEQVAEAGLRPDEPFLGLGRFGPYVPSLQDAYVNTGEIPPFVAAAFDQSALQDPPTGTPPPLPPQPKSDKADARPRGFRPGHRRPVPAGMYAVAAVGLALATFAAGWVSCWAVVR